MHLKKLIFKVIKFACLTILIVVGYNFISTGNGQTNQTGMDKNKVILSTGDDNTFPNIDYPFLHKDNTPNTLKPFFLAGDGSQKPDIVVIIIESMGKAYSGKDAYLGSFTPFLDSLADHSLYWENCLSGGGRTFAALPSIFGSLPFLEHGYLEAGEKAPLATSLIKIL